MEKTKEFTLVDKRQFPRFSVHYLADIYLHEKWLFATVIDISEGGIGIISAEPVNVGDILTMKIRCKLDNDPKANIQFDAKIVWVGNGNEKMLHTCGLEIAEISQKDQNILRDHIQELAKPA